MHNQILTNTTTLLEEYIIAFIPILCQTTIATPPTATQSNATTQEGKKLKRRLKVC